MLRTVQTSKMGLQIVPGAASITGASASTAILNGPLFTLTTGSGNFQGVSNGGARRRRSCVLSAVERDAFAQNTSRGTVPTGNYVGATDTSGGGGLSYPRNVHFAFLDFIGTNLNSTSPLQSVLVRHNMPRLAMGLIADDGDIVVGKADVKSVEVASSIYTVKFKRPFARNPVILTEPIHASAVHVTPIQNITPDGFEVHTFSRSGAADCAFMFMAFGSDVPSEQFARAKSLKCSGIAPRLECATFTRGASPAVEFGHGALTRNGTGDLTWTFEKPFLRTPIVISSGDPHTRCKAAPGLASVGIMTNALATGNADDGSAANTGSLLAIGWDYPREI